MPRKPGKTAASRRGRTKGPARPVAKRSGKGARPANLQARIRKYVDVILDVGVNLQPGQRLLIVHSLTHGVDISLAPFVRLVAEAAYARGAALVDVVWGDPLLEKLRLKNAPAESIRQYPKWPAAARLEQVEAGGAYLSLRGDDPGLLAQIDPKLIAQYLAAIREPAQPVTERLSRNAVNWCVATVSTPMWAAKVLPKVPASRREARLWELIFETCRLDQPDPVANWRAHIANLAARRDYLTRKQYAWLSYEAPGTHFKIGLPPGHVWQGGQLTAANGVGFVPNLPTEEVFTLADRSRAEGEITATKPFVYGSTVIDGMHLTFSEGKVVQFSARHGQSILDQLLRTDEGSSRLGEVALVPHGSPVSRLGVTFHSTLFDENAASHLAFGNAYRFTHKDGETATTEQFAQAGGNSSRVHSDFMIGSRRMDIDGILPDGRAEPIMRSGEWVFQT